MIRAALINEHMLKYDLDFVAKTCIKSGKSGDIYPKLAELFGGPATRNAQMKNISRAPASIVGPYAMQDARVALKLWMWQQEEIARQDLHQVVKLEQDLFPHIFDMERRGLRVDVNAANATVEKLSKDILILRAELNKCAGFEVNPNPSGSIKKLFEPRKVDGVWTARDGTPLPETDGGQPSIGADQLRAMNDPAAAMILKCRQFLKARDTFIAKHILERERNGRIHPNINQTKGESDSEGGMEGTGTGRLSYTRPALQQIPSRDRAIASIVRPVFLPDDNQSWCYGDLDQHEFRIYAHYVNAPALIDAYRENPDLDIHQIVADMTGLPRSAKYSGQANAKQINLGMVFNMGGGTLAYKMGLPFTVEKMNFSGEEREVRIPGEETLEVMERYYAAVPGVREIAKSARAVAKSRGYVRTMMGRHIRFPRGQFTHKASGLIYQGTSADLNKSNIIRICEYLKSRGDGRLLLNIHDEYSISADPARIPAIAQDIKALIQDRPEIRVPIRIDFSAPAKNWWEATEAEKVTK